MPELSITRRYQAESAHFLTKVPKGHKCEKLHGHHYQFDVTVRRYAGGTQLGPDGFIIDFWELDAIVAPIIARLDHNLLNDIPGLENPTAENIAIWLNLEIHRAFHADEDRMIRQIHLASVTVFETPNCSATIKGKPDEEMGSAIRRD